MANVLINIMLRQVGRIWECRAACALHDATGTARNIDNKDDVLNNALTNLPCNCWKAGTD